MEYKFKACYTPEEVLDIVFCNQMSLTTLRKCMHIGQIPFVRMGEGNRSRMLIPGTWVREMVEQKGFCAG